MSIVDFFKDSNGQLSMSRLLCFLTFIPATIVVLRTDDINALGYYLGAYVAGYIGGKIGDAVQRNP